MHHEMRIVITVMCYVRSAVATRVRQKIFVEAASLLFKLRRLSNLLGNISWPDDKVGSLIRNAA